MPFDTEFPKREPPPAPRPRQLTGRGVWAWFILFFGSVFAANAALTWSALRTLPGGELENAYDASQSYNGQIALARAQDERGWRGEASVRAERDGARIAFDLRDRDGAPLPGLAVRARIEHPADHRADRNVDLAASSGGYAGFVDGLHPGEWILQIVASRGGDALYETRNRFILRKTPEAGDAK